MALLPPFHARMQQLRCPCVPALPAHGRGVARRGAQAPRCAGAEPSRASRALPVRRDGKRGMSLIMRSVRPAAAVLSVQAAPYLSSPYFSRLLAPRLLQDLVDSNVLPICELKPKTLGEKEQDFLMALQSFYDTGERLGPPARHGCGSCYGALRWPSRRDGPGKPMMSDAEFDVLKESLIWEGSKVVVLSKDEMARPLPIGTLLHVLYASEPAFLPAVFGGRDAVQQGQAHDERHRL